MTKLALTAVLPLLALAQQDPALTVFSDELKQITEERAKAALSSQKIREAVSMEGANRDSKFARFFQQKLIQKEGGRFVRESANLAAVEASRTDKQVGSTSSSSGTTSLVSKGAVPAVLGFAVEHGALTKAVSGTAVTFRGNLIGVFDLLMAEGFLNSYDDDSPSTRFLRRVSYGFTLDTSRQSLTEPTTDAGALEALRRELRQTRQQVSSWTARLDLWSQRDVRNLRAYQDVQKLMSTDAQAMLKSFEAALDPVLLSNEYKPWEDETVRLLTTEPAASATDIFVRRMDALYEMAARLTPDFEKKLTAALGGLKRFNADRKALLGEIAKRPLLAFEYLNQRDPTLPDVSTYRLIYEQQMGRTRADITANVSASIFNSVSGAMQGTPVRDRWRDFQFSGQADIPLGRRGGCTDEQASMNPVLTISALAERLRERTPVSFAGFTLEAEKGTIAVAQAKLTIPWGGTGVKVPISFSIANRTELIHEKKELRANIGVTFDFDSVAALFKR